MKRSSIKFMAVALVVTLWGCTEEEGLSPQSNAPEAKEVSQEVKDQILQLGFSDQGIKAVDNGYIVEGDILLTADDLQQMQLPVGVTEEHYRTTNTVTGLPRTITVYVSTSFQSQYFSATDAAIARYNAENLDLSFTRVTSSSGADIVIQPSPWYYAFFGILGSAGFPTAAGDPHNQILLTTAYYNGVSDIGALTTTIAHEMGHCIGFRHTDYMDRSYSCGGATDNEGDGGVGAIYIPGTPSGPSAASWMLACSDGTDRPFTSQDQTALSTLY